MKKAYSIVGVVLLVQLALQFYLIAAGALQVWGADQTQDTAASVFSGFKVGDNFAMLHAINGTFLIPIAILAMIGLSFGARMSSRLKWQTGALFGLMVVQFLLALVGSANGAVAAAVGGLHGLNALAIVGLTGTLVQRTWAFRAASATTPSMQADSLSPAPTVSGR